MFIFHLGWYSVDLYSTYLPVLIVLVPPVLVRVIFATQRSLYQGYWCGVGYLIGAALSWIASIHALNIPIGNSESTTTHIIGGALIVPFLYGYLHKRYLDRQRVSELKESLGITFDIRWIRFGAIFAFSSTFGVVNELAEATLVGARVMSIESSDTWNDLIANAVGTILAFAVMEIWRATVGARTKTA